MALKFSPDCDASWAELTKQNGTTNWIVWVVENKEVKPKGAGTGGLQELVGHFGDDGVHFGCFKVLAVDNRENTTSIRTKFIAFSQVGDKVPVLKKANAGPQRQEIFSKFKGTALSIDVAKAEEMSPENVRDRLLASGGAHKPTHYDFGDGRTAPVDAFHGKL